MFKSKDNKVRLSMKDTLLFKNGKLSMYYLRPNDVLAFNTKGLQDGLIEMYKAKKNFFDLIFTKTFNPEIIDKIGEQLKRIIKPIIRKTILF